MNPLQETILTYLKENKSNQSIAEVCGLSVRAVAAHVMRIKKELGPDFPQRKKGRKPHEKENIVG